MFKEELFAADPAVNVNINGIEGEFYISQFRAVARKYFPQAFEKQIDPSLALKLGNKFFELTKNTPINEYFLEFDSAPLFWLYESPILKVINNYYRLNNKSKLGTNGIISFIEYYEKWIKVSTPEEKKYFAGSAVNIVEHKNLNKNFYLQLLLATIKIYDRTYFDPAAATDILNQVFETILGMNLEADSKNEICYYINIFNGISYLQQKMPDKASYYFTGALVHKQDGINAKFYSALADVIQANYEPALKQISELFDVDAERLKYAISQDNEQLFHILCKCGIVQNIFGFKEFAGIIVDLNQEINDRISMSEAIYLYLKNTLIAYGHIEHMILKEPSHVLSIQTIEKILHKFGSSHNLGYLLSLPMLDDKFVETINDIIARIEAQYETQVQAKLATYTLLIEESRGSLRQLAEELEMSKSNVKIKVDRLIAELKERIDQMVLAYEQKIKSMDFDDKYNPVSAFKSAMSYNLFISVVVLLVAGFATYSNNSNISEISNYKNIISSVVLTGTKWGILAFLIGTFFSALQSSSIFVDRNSRKQRLLRKIQEINEQREPEIARIRKEGEALEASMVHKIKEKIAFHEGRIDQLEGEKEKEAVTLRQKFAEQLNEDTKDLKTLLRV